MFRSIDDKDAVHLGKALQALLATAFSFDNFGPFLDKSLRIIQESGLSGPGARLAVTLKSGRVPGAFRGFPAADRARLLAGKKPEGARAGLYFTEPVRLGNARAGQLAILLKRQPASRLAVQSLLGLAAQFVSARLQAEERDAALARERDISYSVKHIEELYLSFPDISIEEISRAVLDEARRLTGSTFGFAGYLGEDGGRLTLAALTREAMPPAPAAAHVVFDRLTGLPGWVIRHKKPLLSNAAARDRRAGRMPSAHMKIDRFLGVPAIAGRRLAGMLALANPPRDFSPADLEAAEKLARVYAMILQRKRADDRRKEEDSRFRAILASTRDVIYTVGPDGRVTYVSPRCADYGYEPEELMGRPLAEIAHPDDKDFLVKAFAKTLKTGTTLPVVPYRVRRKDGSYAYVEQKSGVVMKDGRLLSVTGVVRDVTEQRQTERLLRESEALMRMVFDTAKDAIFVKDMNGMYVKVNKAAAEFIGAAAEEMIGRTDYDFLPREAADGIFRTDSEAVRTGRTLSLNNLHPFRPGPRYMNVIKTPLKNSAGEIIGLLCVARDITELKRMEGELAVARAAEALSKVARPMAHDFNNALAAINGYATLIADDLKPDSPIKTEIARIIEAVRRAAVLTSKFQDFARNPKLENSGEGGERKEEKK